MTVVTLSNESWKEVSATTHTISIYENGLILETSADVPVTITVPSGLPQGFVIGISQGGTGQVTLSAGAGVTILEPDSQFATEKQYVLLSLVSVAADNFRLYGRTA